MRDIWAKARAPEQSRRSASTCFANLLNRQIWDLREGHLLYTLKAHAGPVNGVDFSPDGPCSVISGMVCAHVIRCDGWGGLLMQGSAAFTNCFDQ